MILYLYIPHYMVRVNKLLILHTLDVLHIVYMNCNNYLPLSRLSVFPQSLHLSSTHQGKHADAIYPFCHRLCLLLTEWLRPRLQSRLL